MDRGHNYISDAVLVDILEVVYRIGPSDFGCSAVVFLYIFDAVLVDIIEVIDRIGPLRTRAACRDGGFAAQGM